MLVTKGGVDFHTHSNRSDGSFSPAEVVEYAKGIGLDAVGLCDHDTTAGHSEAKEAAKKAGIEFVAGIEFTTVWDREEHHLLGYYMDGSRPTFRQTLVNCITERKARIGKAIERLRALGYDVPPDMAERKGGEIDRGDIVWEMIRRGYAESFEEGYPKFFDADAPGYVIPYTVGGVEPLTVKRAIEVVHGAGGTAILAHPMGFMVKEMPRGRIKALVDFGIDGLEVYHPRQSPEVSDYLLSACREHGLIVTGGSDCHGRVKDKPRMGMIRMSLDHLDAVKARAAEWKKRAGV
ncbi:MAG: hypothetical protein DRP79_02575 [Planctomycetota bacterium]|nr:MAG: hypothetical protein DRP79_02575 [Planctomycetota bacterium]